MKIRDLIKILQEIEDQDTRIIVDVDDPELGFSQHDILLKDCVDQVHRERAYCFSVFLR